MSKAEQDAHLFAYVKGCLLSDLESVGWEEVQIQLQIHEKYAELKGGLPNVR